MLYDMKYGIQLQSINYVGYNLSISLQILCIIHVGIYHSDNNGDNYPSHLDFIWRLRGCWSNCQTLRPLCTAHVCKHMHVYLN